MSKMEATTEIRPEVVLSDRELALAVDAGQWQRKYTEAFADLAKAELRIVELEAENALLKAQQQQPTAVHESEIERLPHSSVITRFLEKHWWR